MKHMASSQTSMLANPVLSGLIIAVSVASPSLAYVERQRFASEESGQTNPWFVSIEKEQPESHVSLVEMLGELKQRGFPITSIAQLAGVERKTIYSWLEGSATPHPDREARVATIFPVLKASVEGDFALLHRVWRSKTREGVSLESLFEAEDVDSAAVEKQLSFLASSIANLRASEARRKAQPLKTMQGRNGFVEDSLVADFERI